MDKQSGINFLNKKDKGSSLSLNFLTNSYEKKGKYDELAKLLGDAALNSELMNVSNTSSFGFKNKVSLTDRTLYKCDICELMPDDVIDPKLKQC